MKKCFDSRGDVHIALLQVRTTPLGQGLPSPATLLFNCLVRGIMPVMDRPLMNTDNDEEHHKALVNRQCTKDNFQKFCFFIGSTVAVQWEDGGPLTDGTIGDKGDHNHHHRSYKICITKTGRIITHNRQHIRPTPISAEHNLCNQLSKHTKTDPLNTILDHLEKHPPPPTITDTPNERPHSNNTTNELTAPENVQNNNEKQMEEKDTNIAPNSMYSNDKENVIRTRYRRIVKKPDRLTY